MTKKESEEIRKILSFKRNDKMRRGEK